MSTTRRIETTPCVLCNVDIAKTKFSRHEETEKHQGKVEENAKRDQSTTYLRKKLAILFNNSMEDKFNSEDEHSESNENCQVLRRKKSHLDPNFFWNNDWREQQTIAEPTLEPAKGEVTQIFQLKDFLDMTSDLTLHLACDEQNWSV